MPRPCQRQPVQVGLGDLVVLLHRVHLVDRERHFVHSIRVDQEDRRHPSHRDFLHCLMDPVRQTIPVALNNVVRSSVSLLKALIFVYLALPVLRVVPSGPLPHM